MIDLRFITSNDALQEIFIICCMVSQFLRRYEALLHAYVQEWQPICHTLSVLLTFPKSWLKFFGICCRDFTSQKFIYYHPELCHKCLWLIPNVKLMNSQSVDYQWKFSDVMCLWCNWEQSTTFTGLYGYSVTKNRMVASHEVRKKKRGVWYQMLLSTRSSFNIHTVCKKFSSVPGVVYAFFAFHKVHTLTLSRRCVCP
jgi:hypothetical protein